MKLRNFSDIAISPITFGTMRLDPACIEKKSALALLNFLYDHGINAFHSSYEYETYSYFCEVFKTFQKKTKAKSLVHIVKVPVPHFKDTTFSKNKFELIIDRYLKDLNTDHIDIVQWLLRHEPNNDEFRLPIFRQCEEELTEVCQLLKTKGKIKCLASFPYSHAFAEQIINSKICSGLIDYLNLAELERVKLFDTLIEQNKNYIAIRPLMGGKLSLLQEYGLVSPEQIVEFAIKFSLLHPAISSAIISLSSIEHAKLIIKVAMQTDPDINQFMSIVNEILSVTLQRF